VPVVVGQTVSIRNESELNTLKNVAGVPKAILEEYSNPYVIKQESIGSGDLHFVNGDSSDELQFDRIKSVPVLQRKDLKGLTASMPNTFSNPDGLKSSQIIEYERH